ncbi:MAG TPA: restriction endonuclease [Bryobacteraceae bacterium]|nr:restriction endonuclease [Bryobacteraceae bacterium]
MSTDWKSTLREAELLVDKVFTGGRSGNASDDPLPHLIGVSNQGGFRYIVGKQKKDPWLVVLTSNLRNPDWPDNLDKETGVFTYFGDNKQPGHELHDTPRFGNLILRDMFERSHGGKESRLLVPPVLVFANTGTWRDVEFLGLAVPGAANLTANDDLVAVWKQRQGKRFQNYQAKFTILDAGTIPAQWIADVKRGEPLTASCPPAWRRWVEQGVYTPLKAPRVIEHRTREEQLPSDKTGEAIIQAIRDRFAEQPVRFEACAAKIAELMLGGIAVLDLTRPTRDGGRDAIGKYQIGEGASAVLVDFALEAKCYGLDNSVGVKELSRLISRLRHRQFGVLVTTSYVASQAYQEIKEDEHPIVIICASDIVRLLKAAGIASEHDIISWLEAF